MRNGVEITEPRRTNPQGLTGTLATPRAAKGGRLDGGRGDLNGLAARGCMGPTGADMSYISTNTFSFPTYLSSDIMSEGPT